MTQVCLSLLMTSSQAPLTEPFTSELLLKKNTTGGGGGGGGGPDNTTCTIYVY